MIKRLGGIPIAMPQSETPEAIQKGIVKGIVSSMEILKDFNFAAYCPYATDVNLFVVSFAVVMNKEKWDSLPADVKKVIDDMRREQAEWTGNYVDNHVKEALAWSKQKYNHQVFQLSAADRAADPETGEAHASTTMWQGQRRRASRQHRFVDDVSQAEEENTKRKVPVRISGWRHLHSNTGSIESTGSFEPASFMIAAAWPLLALMVLATGNVILRIFQLPLQRGL